MQKGTISIYNLADENGNIFYVGCTVQGVEKRVCGHISEAKNSMGDSRNRSKNKRIIDLNYNVVSTVIDVMEVETNYWPAVKERAQNLEKKWIKKYLELGYDLVNVRGKEDEKIKVDDFIGRTIKIKNGKIV